ncbi:hypothetical protein QYF36_017850 [Acer negundo]|nr:hypothetical protein QYF36_017850 [Acer negundo]
MIALNISLQEDTTPAPPSSPAPQPPPPPPPPQPAASSFEAQNFLDTLPLNRDDHDEEDFKLVEAIEWMGMAGWRDGPKEVGPQARGFKSGFFDPYTMVVYNGDVFVYADYNIVGYTDGLCDIFKEAEVMSIMDLDKMWVEETEDTIHTEDVVDEDA